jgi:hypothetical protein
VKTPGSERILLAGQLVREDSRLFQQQSAVKECRALEHRAGVYGRPRVGICRSRHKGRLSGRLEVLARGAGLRGLAGLGAEPGEYKSDLDLADAARSESADLP